MLHDIVPTENEISERMRPENINSRWCTFFYQIKERHKTRQIGTPENKLANGHSTVSVVRKSTWLITIVDFHCIFSLSFLLIRRQRRNSAYQESPLK